MIPLNGIFPYEIKIFSNSAAIAPDAFPPPIMIHLLNCVKSKDKLWILS